MLKTIMNVRLPDTPQTSAVISTVPNGCFALLFENNEAHLYNAYGKCIKKLPHALDVKPLNNASYFVKHLPDKNSYLSRSIFCNTPVWSLYNKDDTVLLADLSDCTVYANDWYSTVKNGQKKLFRADHSLAAENFTQCAVFKNGYALRINETYYKYADWKLFKPDGSFMRVVRCVEEIIGDGLILVRNSPYDLACLYDFEYDEMFVKDIRDYQTFSNGRFGLTIESKSGEITHKMYNGAGHRISVTAPADIKFLPDARFIQFNNNLVCGIHYANGLLITDEIWRYAIAACYYITEYEGVTTLYNDKSEDLGDGYSLIDADETFALFENEQAYHLFNQYGEVLSLPME